MLNRELTLYGNRVRTESILNIVRTESILNCSGVPWEITTEKTASKSPIVPYSGALRVLNERH